MGRNAENINANAEPDLHSSELPDKRPSFWIWSTLMIVGFLLYFVIYYTHSFDWHIFLRFIKGISVLRLLSRLLWPNVCLAVLGLVLALVGLFRRRSSHLITWMLLILSSALALFELMWFLEVCLVLNTPRDRLHINPQIVATLTVTVLLAAVSLAHLLSERKTRLKREGTSLPIPREAMLRLGPFLFVIGAFFYLFLYIYCIGSHYLLGSAAALILNLKTVYMMLGLVFALIKLIDPRPSIRDACYLMGLCLGWLVWDMADLAAGMFEPGGLSQIASYYSAYDGRVILNWAGVLLLVTGGIVNYRITRKIFQKEFLSVTSRVAKEQPLSFYLILAGLTLFLASRFLPAFFHTGQPAHSYIQWLVRAPDSVQYILYVASSYAGLVFLFALLFFRRGTKWIMPGFVAVSLGFLWVVIEPLFNPWYPTTTSIGVGFVVPLIASLVLLAGAVLGLVQKKPRETSPKS